MANQYDLTAPGVWEFVYDETFQGVQPTPDTYIPIPRITIPVLLQERVLVVGTSSESTKPNWRFAGTLTQRLSIPGLGAGLVDSAREALRINGLTLVVFPHLTQDYQLDFDVYPWIRDITVAVWRYTGPEFNSTEELIQTLKVDILRVETKIDQI